MLTSVVRAAAAVLVSSTVSGLYAQETQLSTTVAAVPRLVRITSAFRPANGLPAAPVESVTFSIYKDDHDLTPLWQETQNVALDAESRYTVLMGSSLSDGIPLDLFSAGEPRWLGVQFNRPGESEQPRVLLVSVPYALKAADADTLGGKPASAYLLSPAAARDETSGAAGHKVSKNADTSDAVNALTSGTTGAIAKFTSATELGDSGMFETNGQIGVGTTNPFDKLHTRFTDTSGGFTGYAVQNLGNSAASYSGMLFYDQNGALGQFQGFNNSTHEYRINNIASGGSINFMIGSSSKFLVANNGNIGIGTATPTQKLDVAGATKVTSSGGASLAGLPPAALASEYTGTSGVAVAGYGSDPVTTNAGVLGGSNSSAGWGGFFLNFKSTGRSLSAFDSALNETFMVAANGRVSIGGNGAPGPTNLAKLTVKASGTAGVVNGTGTISVTTGSTTLTGSGTAFLSELGVGDRIIVASTNQALIITAIASDTSATISTTTAITAAGSTYTIQQAHFRLDDSGGTARMVIQNQGNATPRIGLGTVVPGDALDVRGTVFSSSKLTIGPNNNRRSLFTVKGITFAQNAGTVSVSNSSTTVTGTNTAFLTQVGLGDKLAIGAPVNQTRTVVAITDNLTLTVDSPFATAGSGVTSTTIPALIRADDVSGNSKFLVNDAGNVGIGTLLPNRELEVNGGVRLNTVAAKPACDASLRGTFWVTQGGPGVADAVEACTKDASDAYAWRPLL